MNNTQTNHIPYNDDIDPGLCENCHRPYYLTCEQCPYASDDSDHELDTDLTEWEELQRQDFIKRYGYDPDQREQDSYDDSD